MMSRETARLPVGHTCCLRIVLAFLYLVLFRQVAAGASPAGTVSTLLSTGTGVLSSTSSSFSRNLAQEEASSGGKFAGVDRCPELDAILTATNATSRLGNFTEIPEPSLIAACSSSSALYLLDGESLADALADPSPLLKRVILENSDAVVWPVSTGERDLAPGSVNMIDCQNGVLDLRNRNFNATLITATMFYFRCLAIFPDTHGAWTSTTYWYDGQGAFPCNGTSAVTQAADFPRSAPGYFPRLSANLSPDIVVHTRNYSSWCYDEEDLRDLLQLDIDQETADDSSPRTWVPVLISICVVLLLCAIGLGVWLCLGRPCCSCQPKQAHTPKHSHRYLDNKGPSSLHYQSTEELAAALTTVLTSHRFGSDGREDTIAPTHSSRTSGHQERGLRAPHECKDCGHPFNKSRSNSVLHVQSASRSVSTPDERHCHNCSVHLGSGGEASDPYDDLELPPRTYSGTSRARYEPRDPRTRLAGTAPVAVRGRVATDAWVEDSLEARAQVSGGVRLGPDRERFSDVDTMSYDERRSGSISFAPPRRVNGSGRVNVLEAFTRPNVDAASSPPPSPRSMYFDAQETQGTHGHSCSANSSPSLPNASPRGRDYFSPWRSRNGGFGGPGGSPRHPGLKQYDSPPATHPILGANSPRRPVSRGGNDQEGMR